MLFDVELRLFVGSLYYLRVTERTRKMTAGSKRLREEEDIVKEMLGEWTSSHLHHLNTI